MRSLCLILAPLLVTACIAAPIAPPAPRDPPTDVSAPFGETWDAVIDEFASQNIPIATIDRSSGIVATAELRVPEGQPEVADCGTMGRTALWPTHATYNVLVRGDSLRSTVRVNARWVREGITRGLGTARVAEDCSTRGIWETNLEQAIKAAAERP